MEINPEFAKIMMEDNSSSDEGNVQDNNAGDQNQDNTNGDNLVSADENGDANSSNANNDDNAVNNNADAADADKTATNDNQATDDDNNAAANQNNNAQEPEITEESILKFFQSRNKNVTSIDQLLAEPEIKEVNPYEKISPVAKAFLDFHVETNRDLDDYLKLQEDISAIPDIELAREQARLENGSQWSDDEIDAFLEKKLGIDLSDTDKLESAEKIALHGYSKSLREAKLADQEKYKLPKQDEASQNQSQQQPTIGEDEVQLEDGRILKKVDYDKMLSDRESYLNNLKASSDKIKGSSFSVKIDNDGTEQILNLSYDFSEEDTLKTVASGEDLSATLKTLFGSDKGFKSDELFESVFWIDKANREKAISAIVHKALAQRTEEFLAERSNASFGTQQNIPASKDGQKEVSIKQGDGFGVKFNF